MTSLHALLRALERQAKAVVGRVDCPGCLYPSDGRNGMVEVVRMPPVGGVLPTPATCSLCGKLVDSSGRYVAHYKRVVIRKVPRAGEVST